MLGQLGEIKKNIIRVKFSFNAFPLSKNMFQGRKWLGSEIFSKYCSGQLTAPSSLSDSSDEFKLASFGLFPLQWNLLVGMSEFETWSAFP